MINEWIMRLTPWILGLAALGFIWAVWAAARNLQTMRSGPYYVVREEARKRGLRLIAVAVGILVVAIVVGGYSWSRGKPAQVSTPLAKNTPTIELSPTVETMPTITPSPTLTFSPTPPPPTATSTPTRIPPADLPPPLRTITPIPLAVTAVPNAQFGQITFLPGSKDAKCSSVSGETGKAAFELGTPKICAYFSVRNVARNTLWTAAWYKDGAYVAGDPLLWDGPANGLGIAFFAEPGRQAGRWELRLYIEDRLQSTGVFAVVAPSASPVPAFTATPTS